MTANITDYWNWLAPIIVSGILACVGVYVLLKGRYDVSSTWELRGPVSIPFGILFVVPLPIILVVNPSLGTHLERRTEAAERLEAGKLNHERMQELREEKTALEAERDTLVKERKQRQEALEREFIGEPGSGEESEIRKVLKLSQLKGEKGREYRERKAAIDRDTVDREKAANEKLKPIQTEYSACQALDKDYMLWASRNNSRPDKLILFLFPVAWGAALHGSAWMMGKQKAAIPKQETPPTTPSDLV